MTNIPYTDDDVLRAAITAHRTLINRMDRTTAEHGLGKQTGWPWVETGSDEHDVLCMRVVALVADAPVMAQWAVELGAASLDRTEAHAWGRTEGLDVAVQIAAHQRLQPAIRNELMRAVKGAVESTYAKYLGQVPQHHTRASAR